MKFVIRMVLFVVCLTAHTTTWAEVSEGNIDQYKLGLMYMFDWNYTYKRGGNN